VRYQEAQALFLQQREEISEAVAEKEAIARQLKVPREGVCRVLCRVLRGTFNSCEIL